MKFAFQKSFLEAPKYNS